MDETNKEALKEIAKTLHNIDGVLEIWIKFTLKQMSVYLPTDIMRKHDPKDIVSGTFEKLITGKRNWDKEKYPDFYKFMFLVITSEIRNIAKRYEPEDNFYFEKLELLESAAESEDGDSFDNESELDKPDYTAESDDKFLLVDQCFDALEGDAEAQEVLKLRYEERKNREIAELTGLTTDKVEAALKRIHRRVDPLIFKIFQQRGTKLPAGLKQRMRKTAN